jgi:hypothetical protein
MANRQNRSQVRVRNSQLNGLLNGQLGIETDGGRIGVTTADVSATPESCPRVATHENIAT